MGVGDCEPLRPRYQPDRLGYLRRTGATRPASATERPHLRAAAAPSRMLPRLRGIVRGLSEIDWLGKLTGRRRGTGWRLKAAPKGCAAKAACAACRTLVMRQSLEPAQAGFVAERERGHLGAASAASRYCCHNSFTPSSPPEQVYSSLGTCQASADREAMPWV